MNNDDKRSDLETEHSLGKTPIDEENKAIVAMRREIRQMKTELKELSKIKTPFGTILHYPLIFVSVAFFAVFVTCFVVQHLYDTLDEKRLELTNEIKKLDKLQKEQCNRYLNDVIGIIKQNQ